MRILFTGASSFTGFWFVRTLAAAGHDVVAALRGTEAAYRGETMRARRVALLPAAATVLFDHPFGSPAFLDLVAAGPWDLLCHHAAEVGNHRSPDFDVAAALAANTRALPTVLKGLQTQGLRAMLLTGSVFEQNEGAGTAPLRAVSPYGLSKGLTADSAAFWCDRIGVTLSKFVIANPFGPYEEPRFCRHLVESWRRGATPEVSTPFYVRDNIHVDLLAAAYAQLCSQLGAGRATARMAPSLYAESQGAFARRFAIAFAEASGWACPLRLATSQTFEEPAVRINTDSAVELCPSWHEAASWEQMAAFYLNP